MTATWTRRTRILIAIVGLCALAWLVNTVSATELRKPGAERVAGAASLGLLLLGAWLLGLICRSFKLPSVTGFLVFGLLVGPGAIGLISKTHLGMLTLANELAIAMIALTAGGEIRWRLLRAESRLIALITIAQAALIAGGVTLLAIVIVPRFHLVLGELAPGGLVRIALLVGVIAVASSPAVVVAITAEMHARSAFARWAISVAVCKDLALVVLFAVAISIATSAPIAAKQQSLNAPAASALPAQLTNAGAHGDASLSPAPHSVDGEKATGDAGHTGALGDVMRLIFGSFAAGAVLGVLLAWYMRTLSANLPVFVVLAGFGIALGAESLGLEPLIVALVAGMLMENVWGEISEALFDAIEDLSLPVYCVFFATAGAKVDMRSLVGFAPAATVFILARVTLTWIATEFACKASGLKKEAYRGLWSAFVPQAGVSLALLAIVEEDVGVHVDVTPLIATILGAITLEQLFVPVLFRVALARAEELEATAQPDTV